MPEIDPITAEIIRYTLISIPDQIDINITRTAYSPLIYEYKDYAVGLVDEEGRLIAQSQGGVPLFFANALGVAVRDALLVHGRDGIFPGDVIISNHAGTLGQHLNNVVMHTPIFAGEPQQLVGFMAVLLHWIDVGGGTVGSCNASSTTDVFQEGIQYRSIKLWSRGEPNRDIYRMIEDNTRFPRMLSGDIGSQLAGCLQGRDLFVRLIDKYGLAIVRGAIELMWDRSDAAARAEIAALPDGEYTATSFLDDDGVVFGQKVSVEVHVRIDGDEMTVDFSKIAGQAKGPINSGREGGAVAAARIAFMYLTSPGDPPNDGSFRALHVVIPDGTFLSAKGNAPMGNYSFPLPTVVDTIIKTLVVADPSRAAGGHHGSFGVHVLSGVDPRTGELYTNVGSGHGGWGASLGHDGPGPFKTMVHGDTLDVPAEVQEALYPLRIDSQAVRPDSGGSGRFRGGVGLEKVMTVLGAGGVEINMERTVCPPWGIVGGGDGAAGEVVVERLDGSLERVLKGHVPVSAGDRIRIRSAGGGGYGNASERDPAAVALDVRRGYVTRKAARDVYGLELDG